MFGGQWQVRRVSDVAGLPLLAALSSVFLFLATPVTNTISRTTEYQADIFGLDAVRKPDAFASVMLKLSSYRKLEPSKWEEIIFYDHPSGRTRIEAAMRWKKEHITDPDIRDTAKLP
jgi:STE24 endopeptidase